MCATTYAELLQVPRSCGVKKVDILRQKIAVFDFIPFCVPVCNVFGDKIDLDKIWAGIITAPAAEPDDRAEISSILDQVCVCACVHACVLVCHDCCKIQNTVLVLT